jgi:hypothetical protein
MKEVGNRPWKIPSAVLSPSIGVVYEIGSKHETE